MNENQSILNLYEKSKSAGFSCALATVVRVHGSSYRRPGAKMLITEQGEIAGSISGGCLERDLIQQAIRAIQQGEPLLLRYDTRSDVDDTLSESLVQSVGLGCEGVIEIFLNPAPMAHLDALKSAHSSGAPCEFPLSLEGAEIYRDVLKPPVSFLIFGAGPDAVPMSRLAHEIGWRVTVFDCHSSFPVPRRLFSSADFFIQCEPAQIATAAVMSATAATIMTHNFEHDQQILEQILPLGLQYVGLLGPRARSERLLAALNRKGENLHYPMGLDIGGDTPQAVALSVLSEAQAVLSGRKGGFLRDRQGAIHA